MNCRCLLLALVAGTVAPITGFAQDLSKSAATPTLNAALTRHTLDMVPANEPVTNLTILPNGAVVPTNPYVPNAPQPVYDNFRPFCTGAGFFAVFDGGTIAPKGFIEDVNFNPGPAGATAGTPLTSWNFTVSAAVTPQTFAITAILYDTADDVDWADGNNLPPGADIIGIFETATITQAVGTTNWNIPLDVFEPDPSLRTAPDNRLKVAIFLTDAAGNVLPATNPNLRFVIIQKDPIINPGASSTTSVFDFDSNAQLIVSADPETTELFEQAAGCGNLRIEQRIQAEVPTAGCALNTPGDAIPEGETCDVSLPDNVNGGCNSETPVFGNISCGTTIAGSIGANEGTRDLDWYSFSLSEQTLVSFTARTQFSGEVFLVRNDGFCPLAPDAVLVAAADTEPCSQLLVQENLQPGNYIVIVTGTGFDGPGCSTGFNDYWITMSCESGVSPPSNDDCSAPLDVLAGTTNFTTVGATPSGSVATCVGGGGGLQDRDVFFRYVPTFTGMALIDTCSNGATDMADTVLNVFDDCFFGSELACSDDSCGLLSRVWVPVTEGVPVFIRVAGFGASFGTGVLNISEWQQCDLQAPPDAIIESEGCGGSTNDGCSTNPNGGFDNIECGQTVVGTADAELNTRDLDWYLLNQFVDGPVTVRAKADFPLNLWLFNVGVNGCTELSLIDFQTSPGASCQELVISEETLVAGTYVIVVAPSIFTSFPCSGGFNDYILSVNCDPPGPSCPPCAADFNQDDGVDDLDISSFFSAFENGDECADVNGDDGIDDLDITFFFTSFEQGC